MTRKCRMRGCETTFECGWGQHGKIYCIKHGHKPNRKRERGNNKKTNGIRAYAKMISVALSEYQYAEPRTE